MSVLSPFRVEVALKLKDTIAKKARDRQSCGQGGILLPEILPGGSKGDTRDEIGSLAGVSGKTVNKVEYIQTHAPEAAKEQLRTGKKVVIRLQILEPGCSYSLFGNS